jgi:DNA primase
MEITEIKQRLSILSVLSHYNLKPDRSNHIKCPFHEDDKPSCRIYTETNTFHCFGCGTKGDTIEFIQKKEGITKHEAILKAQNFIGLPTEPKPKPKPQPKPEPKPEPTQEQRTTILTEAFKHFAGV